MEAEEEVEVGEEEGVGDGVAVITSSHISSSTSSGAETSKAITTTHEYCVVNRLPLLLATAQSNVMFHQIYTSGFSSLMGASS